MAEIALGIIVGSLIAIVLIDICVAINLLDVARLLRAILKEMRKDA